MTKGQNRSTANLGRVQPRFFTHRFDEELIREKGEAALPPPPRPWLRPFSACSAASASSLVLIVMNEKCL